MLEKSSCNKVEKGLVGPLIQPDIFLEKKNGFESLMRACIQRN